MKDQTEGRLAIVIPLRARENSVDWDSTSRSLERTLLSLYRQTSRHFDCVIVGNDYPNLTAQEPQCESIHFIQTKLKSVKLASLPDRKAKQRAIDNDKNKKLLEGIKFLQKSGVTYSHWFALDADDILSSQFVERVLNINAPHGLLIKTGYVWDTRSDRVRNHRHLHKICGSTSVLANRYICGNDDPKKIAWFHYSHMHIQDYFTTLGVHLDACKSPLVCYVHHDDNSHYHHAAEVKNSQKDRLVDKAVKRFLWKDRNAIFNNLFLS